MFISLLLKTCCYYVYQSFPIGLAFFRVLKCFHVILLLFFVDAPQFKADSVAKFYAWTDSQRNITCTALGEPQPEIEWYHSGSKLEHSETYKVFNLGGHGVLQVRICDVSNFMCKVNLM